MAGRVEQAARPGFADGLGGEQVHSARRRIALAAGEHPRGPAPQFVDAGGAEAGLDDLAQQRMGERQRQPVVEEACRRQALRRAYGLRALDPGELPCMAQRAVDAEHGHGVAERLGVVTEPLEPRDHQRRQALRTGAPHRLGGHGPRRQVAHQLVDEKRVACGHLVHRLPRRGIGAVVERHVDDPGRCRRRQRSGPEGRRRRLVEVREHLGRARLVRAKRDDEQDAHPLDPRGEVTEPAQRRPVRPVQIVDDDRQRRIAGDATHDEREGGDDRRLLRSRGPAAVAAPRVVRQDGGGVARPARQERRALVGFEIADQPLDDVDRDTPPEIALELPSAGPRTPQTRRAGRL